MINMIAEINMKFVIIKMPVAGAGR